MPQAIYENGAGTKTSGVHQEGAADIDEGAIVSFEPYVLIEGILDKLKTKKDSFLNLTFGKSKDRWVRRYFKLHCKEDPEIFFLEQFADVTPKSKVRRTLEMDRISRVDTNMSAKHGSKNWIFSVSFCSRLERIPKDSVLYLAASSEEDMNRWVAKLCLAGRLERKDLDDEEPASMPQSSPLSVHNAESSKGIPARVAEHHFADSFDSFMETPSSECAFALDENTVARTTGYTLLKHCSSGDDQQSRVLFDKRLNSDDGFSVQPYIHLKNCASGRPSQGGAAPSTHQRNRSFGSSSASSSQFSYSSDNDSATADFSSKSPIDLLPPPPRPPKTKTRLRSVSNAEREEGNDVYSNGLYLLNQPLPPPNLAEIGFEDEHGWSGETIRPSCDEEITLDDPVPVSDGLMNRPVPLTPPRVDRTCKPHRKDACAGDDESRKPPPRKDKYSPSPPPKPPVATKPKLSVPLIPRTNPLNRLQRDPVRSEAVECASYPSPIGKVAEYFDPAENLADLSIETESSSASPTTNEKIKPRTVEYVLIDELSTQAVLRANILQGELRAKNSSPW